MSKSKICVECSAPFVVPDYRDETAKFCSRGCKATATFRGRKPKKPFQPGNKHRLGLRPVNAFAPGQTVGHANCKWTPAIVFNCEGCGKSFERKPWYVAACGGKMRFFSRDCFTESGCFQGDKSTSWCGRPSNYRGRGWLEARKAAVVRDGGVCQRCGKVVGDSISVHHRRPFREFSKPEDANRLENLVSLCQSCHAQVEPRPKRTRVHPEVS